MNSKELAKVKKPFEPRGYSVVANDPLAQLLINETLRDSGSGTLEMYDHGELIQFMLPAKSIAERDAYIIMLEALYKIRKNKNQ